MVYTLFEIAICALFYSFHEILRNMNALLLMGLGYLFDSMECFIFKKLINLTLNIECASEA